MSNHAKIATVAVIGTGLIGTGWAASFLNAGINVRLYDQDPRRLSLVEQEIEQINSDMERMVDQAVNIANNAEYYLKVPPLIQVADLSAMSDEVKWMVRNAIDAFVKSDEALAREVCLRDDKVDDYKDKIFHDILAQIKKDVTILEQGLNLILIARNLERIGDHATNIAEDVIFTISGVDIRHGGKPDQGEK